MGDKRKETLLILGGKPIGSCEIVACAKTLGVEVVVADYLSDSPAKKIADESWLISTADLEGLENLCVEKGVTGVAAGVHEFNIAKMLELASRLGLPTYCTLKQWNDTENKALFKDLCRAYGIPVAKTYDFDGTDDSCIEYPVITKPTDSSGSRGFSICRTYEELLEGYRNALKFSSEGKVLVEEFVDSDACIVHYTAIDGDIRYATMSDKVSMSFPGGSRVMALQLFPSVDEERYLRELNNKVLKMLKGIGMTNGPIWIEVFNDVKNRRFVFNEASMRFGGSMTNYPVAHFTGVDQLSLMIEQSLGYPLKGFPKEDFSPSTKRYCILPVHLKPGLIASIEGKDALCKIPGFVASADVHFVGDEIQAWGTAQQVFAYLHFAFDKVDQLFSSVDAVMKTLHVKDAAGIDMLYTLFDLQRLSEVL